MNICCIFSCLTLATMLNILFFEHHQIFRDSKTSIKTTKLFKIVKPMQVKLH